MFHHQINNHTSKELWKDKIWSMTIQKLEREKEFYFQATY
jgi:hypothetical protein